MAKSNNQGQFISVDGRPLSTSRGIGQDIAKLFKSYARAAASRKEAAKSITDPFLCIQVKCLQGSYDVNIEPGKDDVLFEDRELVISMIEGLFRDHYGPLSDAQKASPKKAQKPCSNPPQTESGFEILMSRTRPQVVSSQAESPELAANIAPISPLAHRISPSSGLSSPEGHRDDASHNTVGERPVTAQCRGSRFINPWSISRINASFQTPQRERASQSSDAHTLLQIPQPLNDPQIATRLDYQSPPQSPELTSSGPRHASISSVAHRRRSGASIGSPPETIHAANSSRQAERQRDKERYGNGALDTWFQRTTGALLTSPEETAEQETAIPALSQLAQERFKPPTHSSAVDAVASLEGHEAQNDTPEVLPVSTSYSQEDDAVESDHNAVQEGSMNSGRGFPVLEKWAASLHEGFNPDATLDLEWALDFEKRKKEANQKSQRKRIRLAGQDFQQNSHPTSSAGPSPHKNRYLAAKAALTAEDPSITETFLSTSLSSRDPRAYLMRHQTQPDITEAPKDSAVSGRLHTSRLPFERTPEEYDVHDICVPMPSDISLFSKTWNLTCSVDAYTRSGKDVDIFPDSDKASVLSLWNERLSAIFNKNYTTRNNSPCPEWRVDLASIMAQHLKQFSTN
jgi:DNA mismatch repair ATPase MutL